MCWVPRAKKDERMHIAYKDIHTYKIAVNVENVDVDDTEKNLDLVIDLVSALWDHNIEEPGLYSYFKDHKYNLNVLNECEIIGYRHDNRLYKISEGFHSYSMKNPITMHNTKYFIFSSNRKRSKSLIEQIENRKYINDYKNVSYGQLVKLECIIPRGAKYYKNSDGEYVSNQIIIKGYKKI